MKLSSLTTIVFSLFIISLVVPVHAQSCYTLRPDDPGAVYFTKDQFPDIHADGVGDDTESLQEAVSSMRGGILFIPEGRYRISKSIIVGGGTRIIGYGKERPVIILAANSADFQWGTGKYMFHFAQSGLPGANSGGGRGGMMGGGMMGGQGGMMGGRGGNPGQRRGGGQGAVPGAGNIQGAMAGPGGAGGFGGGAAGFGGNRGGGNRGGGQRGGRGGGGFGGGGFGGFGGRGGLFNDASETTFYSGMDNVDIEIENGNPAAIAIRFHVAQHSYLRHINFNIGNAYAAIEDIGNQSSDLNIDGGKYGIITRRTSPVWQYLLMDTNFKNQTEAGIKTMEAGFTMIRCSFDNMPVAIQLFIGEVEQLYGRDLRMSNITYAGFKHGNPDNLHATVNFENVACDNVPTFYRGDEILKGPSQYYMMDKFSVGLDIGQDGMEKGVAMHHKEHELSEAAPVVKSDIPQLPPMSEWVNANTVGISSGNDGQTNSQAIKEAMKEHKALYFPSGRYNFAEPVRLEKDTMIIGLHPSRTSFSVQGSASDGERIGGIIAPKDGKNIVCSISVSPGGFAGVLWMASPESLLDDVSFGGGGGGFGRGGRGGGDGNTDNTFRNPDLMITDGGGGIFRGDWPHGTSSSEGLVITNTSTKGKIYQMSVEHHNRVELVLQNVENWEIYALQTEEENPAGHRANSMHMDNCKNILFANTYMYRVSRSILPTTYGHIIRNSDNIRYENMKVFSQTRLAFDNAVYVEDKGIGVREQFFTNFVVNKDMKSPEPLPVPAIFEKGTKLEKLATGYTNATGLTTDKDGHLFFSDSPQYAIYRWNEANKEAAQLAQTPDYVMDMAFVDPSILLMIGRGNNSGCPVYSLDLAQNGATLQNVTGVADTLPDTKLIIPLGIHNMMSVLDDLMENRNYVYSGGSNTAVATIVENAPRLYYYAPGTKVAIKAGGTWRPLPQSSNMAPFSPGDKFYVTSEDDGKTYLTTLNKNETLSHCVFAQRGGTSAIEDSAGNVYIASDQVYIYNRDGKQIGVLEIPERPGSLALGGAGNRTLYVGARTSLYAIRLAESVK